MVTTVWAWLEGNFKASSPEWTYSVQFGTESLGALLPNLDKLNLKDALKGSRFLRTEIRAAYINGEGQLPVQAQEFQVLALYVPSGGMLEFVGCDIGELGATMRNGCTTTRSFESPSANRKQGEGFAPNQAVAAIPKKPIGVPM